MPLYDYKCPKCGVFEVEQSIKDELLKNCPTCGSVIKRLISLSGVVLKGSGFYSTDNRKGKEKDAPKTTEKPAKKKTEIKSAVGPKSKA